MYSSIIFEDRKEAGKKLADELGRFKDKKVIVLGIPRGGIVVGYEIAKKLHAPLDIIVPRKLRAPNQPELAIGAITEDGNVILNTELINSLNIPEYYIRLESKRQQEEIARRIQAYKGEQKIRDLTGSHVIVVDDGIATGSTMIAALNSIRKRGAKSIILAVPVASSESIQMLQKIADQTITLSAPTLFFAIGQFYRNFEQTTDEEVRELLNKNQQELKNLKLAN